MGKSWKERPNKWRHQLNHKKSKKHRPYIPPKDWDAMGDDVTKFSYPEPEPRWDDIAS